MMRAPPAWQSLLFVPGDRPDRYAKAVASGADCACIDLEDAVAPSAKTEARAHALTFVREGERGEAALALRVNAVGSDEGRADLADLAEVDRAPDALVLPKVGSAEDVQAAREALASRHPGTVLVPLVETAEGLLHAVEIARAQGVVAVLFGGLDLAADLGAALTWDALLYARSRVVHATALAGVAAIDGPFPDIHDLVGLGRESSRARALGFTAKAAIHPGQIPSIHDAMVPTEAELSWAHRVLATADQADGGVSVVDGRMVDAPVVRAAQRTLARAGSPQPRSTSA